MDIGELLKKDLEENMKGSLPTCVLVVKYKRGEGNHTVAGIPFQFSENDFSISMHGRQIFSPSHPDFYRNSQRVSYDSVLEYQIFQLDKSVVAK